MKKITIIGAGPGGLATALLLAGKGYEVKVVEKEAYVGGRTSSFEQNGFTFDRGPTFFSMPHLLEDLFAQVGRKLSDYLTLKEVDPLYKLQFDDVAFVPHRDEEQTYRDIEQLFPSNGAGYSRFMKETRKKMNALMPLLQNKHNSLFDYTRLRALKALPSLSLGKTLYDELSKYFTDERLKLSFTFQSKYLGMSPWECPGAFSILSFMEHEYGIYHPIGGVNQITKALARAFTELGGTIELNRPVKTIIVKEGRIHGITYEDGEKEQTDELVINADFAYAMSELVEEKHLKKYTRKKLEKKNYSCSTFMIYANVEKVYQEHHHTVLFASDYRKNVEEITGSKTLSADPSIYIHNPIVTDPTLAPEGKSPLYLLAPVPNNFSKLDWEEKKDTFAELVFDQIEKKSGFKDLRRHISSYSILTPNDWEQRFNVYKGATFNLSHNLGQMMYFRPHNQFEEIENCWLTGGGTHPGSGLPTILASATITADGIFKKDKKGILIQ
ncbi:phytoene desaturase family protein [Shouchella lehensis]|uniref:Phytoene dehydrogenase n=1 Tax=Shouchella lehensis G1 TaxID=1246626 RepID=A0A060LVB0_9BACI|nr:phytoene desaturase family protein [Shouchella lehensis]AIC94157.1 phytoene dehydrogenase [Shouchella lehensis G1]RQW20071.1 phytoene desaturase [Bacillus sp. C1-1]